MPFSLNTQPTRALSSMQPTQPYSNSQPNYQYRPGDPSQQFGLAPYSVGPGGDTSPSGFPSHNLASGNSQIVGGSLYTKYTPAWYQAMRDYNTAASGAAGTAAGTYTQNYMNAIPAISGLMGAGTSALGSMASGMGGPGGNVGIGAGGTGGAGGVGVGGGGAVGSGGYVPPIKMPDLAASNAAIFAGAKDKIGQLARSGLNSYNAELGAQGMLGGGAQAQGARDIVSAGQGELGQTLRDLATQQARTAEDVAKTGYGGAIAQRGQDIAAQEANARLALEQRGLNFQMLNSILNGLRNFTPPGGGGAAGGGGNPTAFV